jgi:SSS family solute:Na+ symporter
MAFDPTVSIAVIAIYLLITLGVGLLAWRRYPPVSFEDFVLAKRKIHWFTGFWSAAAAQFSALSFMGFIAFYYKFGVAGYVAILGMYLFLTCSMYYFIADKAWKLGKRFGHITPADVLGEYFSSKYYRYLVGIALILALVPYLQVQYAGVGILLDIATGGLVPFWLGGLILYIIMLAYTWAGGMRSVVWTDTIQGIIMLGAMLFGGFTLVFLIQGGIGAAYNHILEKIGPEFFTIPDRTGVWKWDYLLAWAIPVGLGWILHPHMWARLYYFERGHVVKYYPFVAGFIEYLLQTGGWIVVLAGVLILPNVSPDQYLLMTYRMYFPTVLFGLIAAAGLAAMMSSAAAQNHAVGMVVTRDIIHTAEANVSDRTEVLITRIAIAVVGFIAYLTAVFGYSLLLTSGAAAASLATASILPQIATAMYGVSRIGPVKLTKEGAIGGSFAGLIITLVLFLSPTLSKSIGLYPGIWGLAANIAAFIVVSAFTKTAVDELKAIEWKRTTEIPITIFEEREK